MRDEHDEHDEQDEDERDQQEQLADVAAHLRARRSALAMTIYAIEHRRRTPIQVAAVLERARLAIRRNQLVRTRWTRRLNVH